LGTRISPIALWLTAGLLLSACGPGPGQPLERPPVTSPTLEPIMIPSIKITDVRPDKACYSPDEVVRLSLRLESEPEEPIPVFLTITISHLADAVHTIQKDISLTGGEQTAEVLYTPPPDAPRGYGVDACIETDSGAELACRSTAFDVLEHWTQAPRYGFLTDFSPGRADVSETMDILTTYHLNGLQFYDWMYRHEQFLTEQEPYLDPLGRRLSRVTVENLIAEAHGHNIAAMPYTAIYAASVPFYEEHPDWALYRANKQPFLFGEDFLVYMDPRPGSPWVDHLLDQFDQVLEQTDFDGIHLDQYGDPKQAFDAQGQRFDLAGPLAATINATKEMVRSLRPQGAVVFNAVTNWPIEAVAPADVDFVYIEVWPPYTWFSELHALLTQSQNLGGGKPVVLAAYIDPSLEQNVRLVDAVIFASGGGHIELGERGEMLADAYFPKYRAMSPELAETMRRYYDFGVRYEDVIGPTTQDATRHYQERVAIEGVSTSPGQRTNKVWPIVRQTGGCTAISLINLVGLKSPEWALPIREEPKTLGPLPVRVYAEEDPVRIWLATPDGTDPAALPLAHETGKDESGDYVFFEVPSLQYWSLIVIEWKGRCT